jgi:glycosyltransferase involved in cell wall biosynthesis
VVEIVVKTIPDVKFVLCGAGSNEDEIAIKQLVKEKGVEANVFFPGWVRDEKKDRVLRDSDVFFLPSYNEGMPMSILDAMGYGLPVISTNVGGIPKIVHDGENGTCCDVGDIVGFANEIISILADEERKKSAAKASIVIVENRYSLEAHLSSLEKLYEEELK